MILIILRLKYLKTRAPCAVGTSLPELQFFSQKNICDVNNPYACQSKRGYQGKSGPGKIHELILVCGKPSLRYQDICFVLFFFFLRSDIFFLVSDLTIFKFNSLIYFGNKSTTWININRININPNDYHYPVIDYYNPVIDYFNLLLRFEPCFNLLGLILTL